MNQEDSKIQEGLVRDSNETEEIHLNCGHVVSAQYMRQELDA